MKEAGLTVSDIATHLGLSKPTIWCWIQRWEESGSLQDRLRCGAPRKTTPDQDRDIVNAIQNDPFTNAVAVHEGLEIDVSVETVRRRLRESGHHHRAPAVKQKLEDRHRLGRLRFAQQHIDEDLSYWGRVIFSDEKTFLSSTHGRLHSCRLNNIRYDRRNIYEVRKSGHVTANVWGWLHLYGIGEMAEIDGRFNAEKYIAILEEVMLPSLRSFALHHPEQMIFMQVSCIHWARGALHWLWNGNHGVIRTPSLQTIL